MNAKTPVFVSYKDRPGYYPMVPVQRTVKLEGTFGFDSNGETVKYDANGNGIPYSR